MLRRRWRSWDFSQHEGRAWERLWPHWGRGLCFHPGDIDHLGRAQMGRILEHHRQSTVGRGRAGPPFVCRHGLGSTARPVLSRQLYYFRMPLTCQVGTWKANTPRRHMYFKSRD